MSKLNIFFIATSPIFKGALRVTLLISSIALLISSFGNGLSDLTGNLFSSIEEITTVDVTASVTAKEANAQKSAGGTASLSSPYKTDKDKLSVSGLCVIRGKVIKSDYVLIGSTVLTKSVVKIEESFKGNLKAGETVCVRELGGFVPTQILSKAINNEFLSR